MDSDKTLQEISRKLDILIMLYSYQIVADKTLTHGAPILRRLGLSSSEIAAIFNTTTNTVKVRLAESKRPKLKKAADKNG